MKKILITTDGSENATKALLKAKKYAALLEADVTVLNVVKDTMVNQYTTLDFTSAEEVEKDLKRIGQEILNDVLKLFEGFKGQVDVKLERGDPSEVIIKEVEKKDYDLVIMGSRGLGTFSRTMLGSVSTKVLNHVKTEVLIVKC